MTNGKTRLTPSSVLLLRSVKATKVNTKLQNVTWPTEPTFKTNEKCEHGDAR